MQQHHSLVLMLKLGRIGSRRLRGKTLKCLTQKLSHGSVLVLKATGTFSVKALQVHWKVKTAAHDKISHTFSFPTVNCLSLPENLYPLLIVLEACMLYSWPTCTLLNLAEEASTSEAQASQDPEGKLMSYQLDGDLQAEPSADDDNHANRKIDAQASSSRSDISKPSS